MSSWRKENKLSMRIYYSLDKYREAENHSESIECIEGEMSYVNMPFASTFVNLMLPDGNFVSISRDCILKIEWLKLPKWTLLSEKQVVESAKLRLENLTKDIKDQKLHLRNEQNLEEMLDKSGDVQ